MLFNLSKFEPVMFFNALGWLIAQIVVFAVKANILIADDTTIQTLNSVISGVTLLIVNAILVRSKVMPVAKLEDK